MPNPLSGTTALRTSAALVAAGAVLSGPVAVVVVWSAAPQPTWTSVAVFADNYRSIQTLPYLFGYLLLTGFVLFAASCHALAPRSLRVQTSAALVFTAIYAALVCTNYTIQLGFIPRMLNERPASIADLTMTNPGSFAWFLEMFGYAAMGAATWLAAACFSGSVRAAVIRCLLIANGVLSVLGAACTALFDRWVFSRAGMIAFAVWNLLIPICFILIAISERGAFANPSEETSM